MEGLSHYTNDALLCLYPDPQSQPATCNYDSTRKVFVFDEALKKDKLGAWLQVSFLCKISVSVPAESLLNLIESF